MADRKEYASRRIPDSLNPVPLQRVDLNRQREGLKELSNREIEILGLIDDGIAYDEISQKLSIAISTLYSHINLINKKLGTRDIKKAVQLYKILGK